MRKLLFAVFALVGTWAWACTNLIVGRGASKDGSVIVSYSSDDYGIRGSSPGSPWGQPHQRRGLKGSC